MASQDYLSQQVIKIEVKGLPELQQALRAFGEKFEKNVMRRALYAGAVVFRDEARRRAPVRTGALRKSIQAKSSSPKPGILVARVWIDRKKYGMTSKGKLKSFKTKPGLRGISGYIYPKNYAHLVEFGTRAHAMGKGSQLDIRRKSGKGPYLDVVGHGAQRGNMHPGAKAQPFMRPAYDHKKDEAAAAVMDVARAGLDQAIKEAAAS